MERPDGSSEPDQRAREKWYAAVTRLPIDKDILN
jgi:hypothetical protein